MIVQKWNFWINFRETVCFMIKLDMKKLYIIQIFKKCVCTLKKNVVIEY